MAVFHIILRHLALIGLPLFCEEIDREAFLKECSALVFLVLKDAFHCTGLPALFSRWSRNPICCQLLCNGSRRQPLHESSINLADNDCLLRNDFWKTVCAFAVTEELLVWEVDLSIRKPLPLPPGHVLRNGAAFFLCQARHDGEQQFALAVKGVDVLFFEVDFYAFFFQFADGNQAVDRVSGEAADRFCDDEVDFAGHGIGDHFIEADAMLGVRAGNALVRVYFYKLPFGIAFDVWLVTLEQLIYNDVIATHEDAYDAPDYTTADEIKSLLVDKPYAEDIYVNYLQAQIEKQNGEDAKYNKYITLYNDGYDRFAKAYNAAHRPLSSKTFFAF